MSTILTIQPSSTDNWMYKADPTRQNGSDTVMYSGEFNSGVDAVTRFLIKFNGISDGTIPANAIIESAVMSVYLTANDAANARIHRVYRQKKAWSESQSTWNIYSTGNNWTAAGGFDAADCEQTDIGSASIAAAASAGFVSFTLTASKLQEMYLGTFTNNGFLVKADTELNDGHEFATRENATTANRPKLVITYSTPTTNYLKFYRRTRFPGSITGI